MVTEDGVGIAVHDLGGSGPVLLISHATGFHGMALAPMAGRLSTSYRCLALDERGHGDSGSPPGANFAWDGFASDVLAVVDGLGLELPFGFGHSCGGAAMLLAEQRRPGIFSGLYCYEPIVISPSWPAAGHENNHLAASARRRRAVFASRREAYENYSSKPPLSALAPEALDAYVEYGFADLPEGGVKLKCDPEDEARVYAMAPFHDAFEHLGHVSCPVTVAFGESTDTFGPDYMAELASRLARGRIEMLATLGHFGPMEDPQAVAATVLEAFEHPAR